MPTIRSITSTWREHLVKETLPAALDEGCGLLADQVAHDAPRETGRLARSVHPIPARREANRIEAGVVVNDQKGHLIEYGTVHQAAKPFFRPAIRKWQSTMRKILDAATRK